MENDRIVCAYCEKETDSDDMRFTKDCHGIPYRLVCWKCYKLLMSQGYDGEYYDESQECLDWDY